MKKHLSRRILSLVLVAAMCLGFVPRVFATGATGETGKPSVTVEQVDNSLVPADPQGLQEVSEVEDADPYADTDVVRVSIVLEKKSTLEIAAEKGISTTEIAASSVAMDYRETLKQDQAAVTAAIERQALNGQKLDVQWNLTLAANIISADVQYGQIGAIEAVSGIKEVFLEALYEPAVVSQGEADPDMATSSAQIGTLPAYAEGYTGAGSRIAVIDTGTDEDHQSFDAAAFEYSLQQNAAEKGMSYEEYVAGLDLLDAEEVASVMDQLNLAAFGFSAEELYLSSKLPVAINYVDGDLDTGHHNDGVSEHGSHVAGIATANRYIAVGDTFVKALDLETARVQGVAPDAQLITMKVFGKSGGAYESDYMAAIEDAIILGCDAVNLSLGSTAPGFTVSETYQDIMDSLSSTDTVVIASAGNNGSWSENTLNSQGTGLLYSDDVNMYTGGSPGAYTNSLGVASVDNVGAVGSYFLVGEGENQKKVEFLEAIYVNDPLATLDTSAHGSGTEYEYIFVDGQCVSTDFYGLDLTGKIVFASRGGTEFRYKMRYATMLGAVGVVIYNNTDGVFGMNLSTCEVDTPGVAITKADAQMIRAMSEEQTSTGENSEGKTGTCTYFTGKITITRTVDITATNPDYYTMSSFSSWGVPGDLSLKPEITAPGGSIYSVNGAPEGGQYYEVMSGTSMAAPQVTGMAAILAQYIRENSLSAEGITDRALAQSLLMSTAVPMVEEASGYYYPVLRQGAGLANIGNAVQADAYILMNEDATDAYADGKVKAELGDDPQRTGTYEFSFTVNNLTDAPHSYELSAELFTQALYTNPLTGDQFMDTVLTPLAAEVTFTVAGQTLEPKEELSGLDFDGNGLVNTDDGQALLDYVVGVRAQIENLDLADLDADGDVDTYDAYGFFKELGTGTVVLPASGSVEVTVSMQLTEAQKEELDAGYASGAYVEGYVHVEELATEEGVAGIAHSIPVLAFYGSWGDAKMFDCDSVLELKYPELSDRDGYLKSYVQKVTNAMAVIYADDPGSEYYFGGNPMFSEKAYLPQRNALNNENGDVLSKYQFSMIRNAGCLLYEIVDAETGEVYIHEELGRLPATYYSDSYATWLNARMALVTNWDGTDAEGEKLPEGTTVNISLKAALESHRRDDSSYDWDTLSENAALTTMVTIDNTAPVVLNAELDTVEGKLSVSALDNEYIAAAVFYNANTDQIMSYTVPNQTTPNEAQDIELDLSQSYGSSFYLQIVDYAMNASTWKITLNSNIAETQDFMAFNWDNGYFTTFGKGVSQNETHLYDPLEVVCAAENVDGYVFLQFANCTAYSALSEFGGRLYVAPADDLSNGVFLSEDRLLHLGDSHPSISALMNDLAYNPVDGKLYGVYCIGSFLGAAYYLTSFDIHTGEQTYIGQMYQNISTLACDDEGHLYGADANGKLYTFQPVVTEVEIPSVRPGRPGTVAKRVVGTEIGASDTYTAKELGAMDWDSETDTLYWTPTSNGTTTLVKIHVNVAEDEEVTFEAVGTLSGHTVGLVIPDEPTLGLFDPTNEVLSITVRGQYVNRDTVHVIKNGTPEQLTATVQPWYLNDKTVTWASSDPSIATVDETGNVYGVSAGQCEVTATASDGKTSASMPILVTDIYGTIEGITQDENGQAKLFTWNTETEDTWTAGSNIAADVVSAAYDETQNVYYVQSGVDLKMYKIDAATGETLAVSENPNALNTNVYDMTLLKTYNTDGEAHVASIYGPYLLANSTAMENNLNIAVHSFTTEFSLFTGASTFVAIAHSGQVTETDVQKRNADGELVYDENGEPVMVYSELLYALDDAGYVWWINLYYNYDYNKYDKVVLEFDAETKFTVHATDIDFDFPAYQDSLMFHSMVADETTGDLYLTRFNGTTNEVYVLEYREDLNKTYTYSKLGDFGHEVWPAALGKATTNGAETEEIDLAAAMAELEWETTETAEAGYEIRAEDVSGSVSGLHTAVPSSVTTTETDEKTVTVTITAKDLAGTETTATNGLTTVTYDAHKLTLTDVTVHGDYTAQLEADGTVTFGYVDLAGIAAGEPVATLTFQVQETEDSIITVEHKQVNAAAGVTETLDVTFAHANTEIRDAKEATCTENGYTGDTYCLDCGKLLAEGEEIPAYCPSETFTDLDTTRWYHAGTDFVIENGLMKGISATEFAPDGTLTRAQLVTILYRLAGTPSVEGLANPFQDVAQDKWYTAAILWAADAGIVKGVTATEFAPDAATTREQIAAILYRYAGSEQVEEDFLSAYTDAGAVSHYAVDAMNWAVANGLIIGASETTLAPKHTATRAQIAAILLRYSQQ